MSTHAQHVAELERRVVEAAVGLQKWLKTFGMVMAPREYEPEHHREVVEALNAARAATCVTCSGRGVVYDGDAIPCPAGCDEGRTR